MPRAWSAEWRHGSNHLDYCASTDSRDGETTSGVYPIQRCGLGRLDTKARGAAMAPRIYMYVQ